MKSIEICQKNHLILKRKKKKKLTKQKIWDISYLMILMRKLIITLPIMMVLCVPNIFVRNFMKIPDIFLNFILFLSSKTVLP